VYINDNEGLGSRGNAILSNSIFANDEFGIDLYPVDGANINDLGDGDSGPNNLQNFPLLADASSDGSSTTVEGSLNSSPNTNFRLEFFANAACDPSGYGEGERYLGSSDVTTDANGDTSFSVTLSGGTSLGEFVTAAATDESGNTSEFSACAAVTEGAIVTSNYHWRYEYDGLNRLTYACSDWDTDTASCVGDAFDYSYDGAGNLLSFSRWDEAGAQVETVSFVYNSANQIACLDGGGNGLCGDPDDVAYSYDAYGNLTSDGMKTYTYDAENRLVSVSDGVSTASYAYNGDGDRVSQTVDGVTTSYVLDTAAPLTLVLAETTGTETIYNLHGLDLVAQNDGASTEYFAYDGLGSVRQMLDSGGSVLFAQVFDPYGNPYASAGTNNTIFGFTGEQEDSNGLIFLRARYYDPKQGRFLQQDPEKGYPTQALSFNPWLYVFANPINHQDPSGICLDEDLDGKCDPVPIPPDIQSYNEKVPPSGITWIPGSDPLSRGAGGIPYGVNQAQFTIKAGWTGLCGPVSVAAIIRSKDLSVTAQEVVEKAQEMFGDPNYLGPGNLKSLTNEYIHENYGKQWPVHWGYISKWVKGRPYFWTDEGESRVMNQVTQWLTSSRLIIVGVKANGSGGKVLTEGGIEHWVVLTGISQNQQHTDWESEWNWARIYNPFDNETEYYPWKDLRQSWSKGGNMLVLVKPKRLLPAYDSCKWKGI
jgi:RHS repeat-associated protein